MPIASGLFKQVGYKAESSFGAPPGQSGGQLLRRVQSTLDVNKDTYQSNEIRTDFQMADFRHGVRRVAGKVSGELSAGSYKDFFAAALKKDFTAGVSVASVSVTIAGSGPSYTVTRAAGSFLTDGFNVGDVIRLSVGALNAANLGKNLFIVALTATVATVITLNGSSLVAEGPVTGCTVAVPGKKSLIPQSGHTDKSFAFEHWYSDIAQSELFLGCKPTKIALALPPTGMCTFDMDLVGQDMADAAADRGGVALTTRYFTSPTAAGTTGVLAAVNGVLRIGGSTVANVTGLSLEIACPYSGDPVVGSNVVPQLFPGRVIVTGQVTAYFDSTSLRDAFLNETEVDLAAAFTADNTAGADFMGFALPRIKVGGASKSDGEAGLVQTLPFQALLNVAGGTGKPTDLTTLSIQDTQA